MEVEKKKKELMEMRLLKCQVPRPDCANRLMPQNDAGALSRTGLRCSRIPEVL
ncbi:hypothetical protein Q7C36_000121 [Tachysurus vachellii]|uniref:Uncharacterized protein n=1 Tax=Tachysurus vachellii TaxID=175792 RepID=A0AA88TBZ2_TACVA|nr:hypothetical protein Q7C36_000121 [Tachysurus vachellii]